MPPLEAAPGLSCDCNVQIRIKKETDFAHAILCSRRCLRLSVQPIGFLLPSAAKADVVGPGGRVPAGHGDARDSDRHASHGDGLAADLHDAVHVVGAAVGVEWPARSTYPLR